MKKNYLLLLVFVLLSLSVQGSHSQSTSNLSTSDKQETVLKSVVAKKKDFIGKKVENVYDFLVQKKDFIINHVNTDTTSPWAPDSDGKMYLMSLILYSKTYHEIISGEEFYALEILVEDKNVLDREFWLSLPDDETWIEAFVEKTKNFVVKDIVWYKESIQL